MSSDISSPSRNEFNMERGGTARSLNLTARPLLLTAVASVLIACLLAEFAGRGDVANKYPSAYIVAVLIVLLPPFLSSWVRRPSRRPKVVYFGSALSGVAAGMITFNGMATGLARGGFGLAAISLFIVATVALLVDVETSRDRPVSRL